MKNIILFLFAIFSLSTIQGQDVKFKKGKVSVDEKECLKYDNSNPNSIEISTLNGEQTVFLKFIRTGVGRNGGLYTKVIFMEEDKSFTSRSYIFTKELLVKKLLADNVLVDCAIDRSKVDKFVTKYNENIEETLIRY